MLVRIVSYFFLGSLFFAFFLAISGVEQVITTDQYFYFLRSLNERYQAWSISIPEVPSIPMLVTTSVDTDGLILAVVKAIGNFFIVITNGVILLINVVITLVNVIIQILQLFLTTLSFFKDLGERLINLNT